MKSMVQVTRRGVCAVAVLAALMTGVAGAQPAQSSGAIALPSEAEIRQILAERIGGEDRGFGIVVGVVGPQGRRVVSYGQMSLQDPQPLYGDTVFEIGSVTKVFTALLLADMVQRGEVAFSDPVARHLPAGVKVPERNGRPITLLDLATHTSGLPFMPGGGLDDAGAAKATAQLYEFVARYELPRDAGAEWEYSNVGYWLLAQALASRVGMDYEGLLRLRIIAPLGLSGTALTLTPKLKPKLAVGHDASLQPSPSVSSLPVYSLMPSAGGLYSTAGDLLTLLSLAMGYERSPLAPAMAAMLSPRRPGPRRGVEQAVGWLAMGEGDETLIAHDGGTMGYASSVAWDPKRRIGVVVLANQVVGVGDVALHLLRPSIPLEKPTFTKRTEIALDAAVLDTYAGRYEAQGEGIFVVVREGAYLTIQFPDDWGLPKMRLRPESQREFFASELPLRVEFQTEAGGRTSGILIYPPRGQKAVPAGRVSEPPGP